MSIVIKELFPSDQLSTALEKINFNFDQLILAGGGPPGIQGPVGPQGIAGPVGPRGSYWELGSTSSGFTAQQFDSALLPGGTVYQFDGSDWIDSSINLTGPQGPAGASGGSLEFRLFKGATALLSADSWAPNAQIGPTSNVDPNAVNFYVPANSLNNVLFVGDESWAYDKLKNLTYASNQDLVPKLTIMQRKPTETGFGGLSIGAYGDLEATGLFSEVSLGGTGTTGDARNFFHAGIAAKSEAGNWKNIFRARTNTIDFEIQAGDTELAYGTTGPKITLRSHNSINFKDLNDAPFLIGTTGQTWIKKTAIGPSLFSATDTLHVDGTARITGIANLGMTATVFLTRTSTGLTGIIKERTVTQVRTDIGAVGGTGQINKVAYWNTENTITSSPLFHWDPTNNRLGIGTDDPAKNLHIIGNSKIEESTVVNPTLDILTSGHSQNALPGSNSSAFRAVSQDGLATITTQINKKELTNPLDWRPLNIEQSQVRFASTDPGSSVSAQDPSSNNSLLILDGGGNLMVRRSVRTTGYHRTPAPLSFFEGGASNQSTDRGWLSASQIVGATRNENIFQSGMVTFVKNDNLPYPILGSTSLTIDPPSLWRKYDSCIVMWTRISNIVHCSFKVFGFEGFPASIVLNVNNRRTILIPYPVIGVNNTFTNITSPTSNEVLVFGSGTMARFDNVFADVAVESGRSITAHTIAIARDGDPRSAVGSFSYRLF